MNNCLPQENQLIDRSSPIPAYQQIVSNMLSRIVRGEWELHEKIPSEIALSESYGVSRVTLRQALSILEKDGIIKKYHGKGIFVISNPGLVVQDLSFPSLGVDKKKSSIPSRILSVTIQRDPGKKVKLQLNLEGSEAAVYLRRLFMSGDKIIGINDVWFPEHIVPGLLKQGLIGNSISRTMKERYSYNITAIDNQIEATKLDAVDAQLLNSVYDAPALKIESVHILEDGRPVEYASTIWIGEITRFHFKVTQD